ncbi:transposase [Pseudoxanthomonas gei]|uniref:Transposase n=1 Tax=Pseudoxanthomonas gei TaxID=1383030 RepID=A0ABX0AC00_9GAMM|nr:transposase [Pseudoxanthomonas gei]NDK39089.1 transposase [Pseudoxanthomonas gei]
MPEAHMVKQVREGQAGDGGNRLLRHPEDPTEGWLADAQWRYLASRLPGKLAYNAVEGLGTRRFVEAVLWLAVTDSTWPELPRSYGNFHAAYQRFVRWARLDIWDYVSTCLAGDARLPALQRMVRLHNDVRRRRSRTAAKAAEQADTAQVQRPASLAERVLQLEARVQRAERLLEALFASPALTGTSIAESRD